ncbi:MAG TPA: dethiobiotin synthase [Isosphaeraceae bacterium]|jgi:dethiobiotin synthetase|nr:dethiobiotin synthase [Isosphaeraceae bacterium]
MSFTSHDRKVESIVPPNLAGLFVVGTDTGVGKTWVAAAIARCLLRAGRRVGVLKPVATGATREAGGLRSADAAVLIEAIGGGVEMERVTPIVYEAPLAPPIAARLGGVPLAEERVRQAMAQAMSWWSERAEVLVLEGIGGLLCPLAENMTVADLAVAVDFPLVIVAGRRLGTLNHTLLTVEAARGRGLRVAGIVLNAAEPTADPIAETTAAEELARRLEGVPILAELDHASDPSTLSNAVEIVDWYEWAGLPRYHSPPACQVTAHGR